MWNPATMVLVQRDGVYGRMARLPGGDIDGIRGQWAIDGRLEYARR